MTRSTTRTLMIVVQRKEIDEKVQDHIVERDTANYGGAMESSKAKEWNIAMEEEISAFNRRGDFEVNKRAHDSNVLHIKWVIKTKTDARGEFERFKSHLFASGNEKSWEQIFFNFCGCY